MGVSSWNMTSLQTTLQALNYLFGSTTNSSLQKQHQAMLSPDGINNYSLDNQPECVLSSIHQNYIRQIKVGLTKLNKDSGELIQTVKSFYSPKLEPPVDAMELFPAADRVMVTYH